MLPRIPAIQCSIPLQLSGGFRRCYRSTEEAHQSLDVLSHRCQEELLAHEPESPQTQAPQSDLILQFREQGFHLLSLPLCFGELWRIDQLPRTLSSWLVLVDDKPPEGSTGALWPERARATLFACPDIVEGSIAINPATVVEELARTGFPTPARRRMRPAVNGDTLDRGSAWVGLSESAK